MATRRYDNLTKPLQLRNKTMKSRFVYPVAQPHFLQANELYPSDPIIAYYMNRAKNGAALILLHDLTNLDQRIMGDYDTAHFAMYDLDDKGCQNGFTQFAEYMHYYGTLVCPELNLCNRMPLQINDPDAPVPEGASGGGFMMGPGGPGGRGEPDEDDPPVEDMMAMLMKRETKEADPLDGILGAENPGMPKKNVVPEGRFISGGPGRPASGPQLKGKYMEYYIKATVEHAKTYKNVNMDGGYIDFAANNFLIGKFLYTNMNWRTDEYGGSLENRMRFPIEVVKAVREAVGEDFILAINCPNVGAGFSEEDCATFLKALEPYIDLIQLRAMHSDHEPYTECKAAISSRRMKELGVKTPIFISSYYKDLDSMEKHIAAGDVDGFAPGHLMICNENMGEILKDGNGEDVRPCIECHICRGSSSYSDWMSHCTINPHIGMEHQEFRFIEPVTKKKRVAIVGGGPGGMNCALELVARGHEPVIFEASDELGGQIKSSNYPKFKWELKRYLDWLKNQMVRKNIEVRLNTPATPEAIEAEGFDAVVVAIGGKAVAPKVEGAEAIRWNGTNIYGHEAEIGKKVVVIGGSSTAAEAACYLAECGHEVVELSRQSRIGYDLNPIRMVSYMGQKAQKLGVKVKKQCKTLKIEQGKVTYENYKGDVKTIECDDVVVNGGISPVVEDAAIFRNSAREYYVIGDARQSGTMRHAIRDAYAVAQQI